MALPCNNLNLNLYRVFYTVAKTKSFSESASVLHISQPAISKHIQNLEYELNTVLFYRNNRGIELTPEAKSLLTYVEKAYNFLMLGEKELQESKELLKGKVSIGVPTFISVNLLSSYVKEFMELHPNIVIKMSNKKMSDLYNLLYQHTLDLLIVTGNNNIPKDFKVVSLGKENYVFCYNEEKMKDLNIESLKDLEDKPLLLPVKDITQRKELERLAGNYNVHLDPIMELESNEMMNNYINEGIGIGYMLEKAAIKNNFKIIRLEEELPSEDIDLVYMEDTLTNSSKEFINLLTNK